MDFDSRKNAIELIKSYVARNQGACVFSSHIEDTIDKLATRTLVLRNGQLYDK
jgi:ABC-2 type transport system ATP-binding protein/NitT/TauT family transport system ATP-binding protein